MPRSCLSNVGFAEVNAIRLGWRVVVTSGQVRFDEIFEVWITLRERAFDEIFEVWITWVVEGGRPDPPPPPLIRCARLSAAFEGCRARGASEANELL